GVLAVGQEGLERVAVAQREPDHHPTLGGGCGAAEIDCFRDEGGDGPCPRLPALRPRPRHRCRADGRHHARQDENALHRARHAAATTYPTSTTQASISGTASKG